MRNKQPLELLSGGHRASADAPNADNPGTAFIPELISGAAVNTSAAERRIASLPGRRTVKKEWQASWLLKAITLIDLTTLAGDDTEQRVRRLAAKARAPVRPDLLDAMDASSLEIHAAAVCVYHVMVKPAVEALADSRIATAAVSTGFPAGLSPFKLRLAEIEASAADGAQEIDVVISRRRALAGDWQGLYREVRAFRETCGDALLKTILATGELGTLRNVAKASWVCMMAGADFIKTSTGKEPVNATLPVTLTMLRCIRDYHEATGNRVGFKPAGGISKAKDALTYMLLVKEELGASYLTPGLFRFGASSLLGDIERQLEHHVTGRYSVSHRHPSG